MATGFGMRRGRQQRSLTSCSCRRWPPGSACDEDDSTIDSPVEVADDSHRVRHATWTTRVDRRLRHHLTYHVAMVTVVGWMHLPDACLLHQVVGFRVLRVS